MDDKFNHKSLIKYRNAEYTVDVFFCFFLLLLFISNNLIYDYYILLRLDDKTCNSILLI